jgi:hypothetical protein
MILILVGAIGGFILGSFLWYKEDGFQKNLSWFFGMSMWGLMIMVAGILVFGMCAAVLPTETYNKEVECNKLVCLQDNFSIHGSFLLASGRIEKEMFYVYYYETETGIKLGKLPYHKVSIKYTNNTPVIKTFEDVPTYSWKNWVGVALNSNRTYIFEIPKGSIKYEYQLDLQ